MQARVVTLAVGLACAACLARAGTDIEPGLWQIVTEMKTPGMSISLPAMTTRQCLTAAEISKRRELLAHPPSGDSAQKCKTTDFVRHGDTVTWKMSCHGGHGDSQGVGKVVYDSPTAYHGEIHVEARIDGRTMSMTQHIKARRMGACSP